jgi:hypothetical protein
MRRGPGRSVQERKIEKLFSFFGRLQARLSLSEEEPRRLGDGLPVLGQGKVFSENLMRQHRALLLAPALLIAGVLPLHAAPLPIASWNFDETSGSIAHDGVGSVNGTLMNGATFVPGAGIEGGAVAIDRLTNGFVAMGNHFAFPSGSFSIEAWIKTAPGETSGLFPVAKHRTSFPNGYFLAGNNTGDGVGSAAVGKGHFYDSGPNSGLSSIVINDGQWHQLIGVYDTGSNRAEIFVDGVFQNSMSATPIVTTAAQFLVGGTEDSSGVASSAFRGLIDDVRVYNVALSAADVSAIYHETLTPTVPEPGSLTLLALGALGLSFPVVRRRRPA